MSKILIIGDVHFGDHSNKDIEKEQLYAFEQIQEYVQENNISFVFSVGDIVRKKKDIPHLSVPILAKINKHLTGVYAISGNHDQDDDNFFTKKNDRFCTSKSAVTELYNVRCLDNDFFMFQDGKFIFGVPFYRNAEDFYKAVEATLDKYDKRIQEHSVLPKILLIHQTPNTTPFSENASDTIDIEHPLFDKFDLVICGHIHEHKQLNDKFWQIGGLVPFNRNEVGQKYFLEIDTETLEVKPIPLKQNITFSEKTKIENNSKLSKKVVEKAKEFDLLDAAEKYAEQNEFTDFQKNHSKNTILKARKI